MSVSLLLVIKYVVDSYTPTAVCLKAQQLRYVKFFKPFPRCSFRQVCDSLLYFPG